MNNLQNLSNMSEDDIYKELRTKGVLVKVHVYRSRNGVEVTPKMFGVDSSMSSELEEFTKEHLKNGVLNFLPNTYEKELKKIEAKVRMAKARMAIGYDGEYMTIDSYKEYKKYVEKAEKEYFEVRDRILSNWDSIISNFKIIVKKSLEDMKSLNKEVIFDTIISKIPSKEEYAKSFSMGITVREFPGMNVGLFDEELGKDMKDSIKQESLNTVYDILKSSLQDCFDIANQCLVSFQQNDRIANKTLGTLKESGKKIAKKNLFGNEKIDKFIELIEETSKLIDDDEIAEQCELIAVLSYGYADSLNLSLNLKDSILTENELKIMYVAYKDYDEN